MKFTWGKPMIHVEQKKYPQKSGIKNLAKATNENSISIKEATTQAKNSEVKEKRLPIKKKQSKHRLLLVLLRFCMVFYGFKRKTSKTWTNLLCKNSLIGNLYMSKNTKKQGELT